jgi:prephenate dehydrogenase
VARLLLIGAGLIGASFALAARRAGLFASIVAYDVDAAVADRALRVGAVDEIAPAIATATQTADAVLIAVPPSQIVPSVVAVVQARADRDAVLFDVGSVKAPVLSGLTAALGRLPARFVPCHPMAGAAVAGPEGADPALFEGRTVFLTPTSATDRAAIAQVGDYWSGCGARVRIVEAELHDRAVAATSHLPHLVAAAFAARFASDEGRALLDFAGPGFRDFTRIAGSDPALWRDILTANGDGVVAELDGLLRRLTALRDELASTAVAAELESTLREGRRARQAFSVGGGDEPGGRG